VGNPATRDYEVGRTLIEGPDHKSKALDATAPALYSHAVAVEPIAAEIAPVPDPFRDSEGTSQFAHPAVFNSKHLRAAEDILLALTSDFVRIDEGIGLSSRG
jgi:hypothetical protein